MNPYDVLMSRIEALEKRFMEVDRDRINRIASLTAALETLTKRIAELEARPVQPSYYIPPVIWPRVGYSDDDILAREIKWGGTD